MIFRRILAIFLLLIAFVSLALSHTFPFLDDLSELGETAVVLVGVACGLGGVSLWLRKPAEEPAQETPGDAESR